MFYVTLVICSNIFMKDFLGYFRESLYICITVYMYVCHVETPYVCMYVVVRTDLPRETAPY